MLSQIIVHVKKILVFIVVSLFHAGAEELFAEQEQPAITAAMDTVGGGLNSSLPVIKNIILSFHSKKGHEKS